MGARITFFFKELADRHKLRSIQNGSLHIAILRGVSLVQILKSYPIKMLP